MARKSNNQRIIDAYNDTVDYFRNSDNFSFIYQLFYSMMNADNAEEITDNIEYLRNIDPRTYCEAYDFLNGLYFIRQVIDENPSFAHMCVDYAFEVFDNELNYDYTGIEDTIERAWNERSDRMDGDKYALHMVLDINYMIINEAASYFAAKYDENMI